MPFISIRLVYFHPWMTLPYWYLILNLEPLFTDLVTIACSSRHKELLLGYYAFMSDIRLMPMT
jgi:hypothetical protein